MALVSEETIYQQSCEEFRSLNTIFWQNPILMMTLNGGLWYSVASLSLDATAQRGILWFAVLANVVMIFALWRIRTIMQDLLDRIYVFEGREPPKIRRVIQALFSALLAAAAIGAGLASCDPKAHFPKTDPVVAKAGNEACHRHGR